jgi:hypothetical protein
MTELTQPQRRKKVSFALVVTITILSLAFSDQAVFSAIYSPIEHFTTTLHEFGHALACSATGGNVAGLTIVSDGQGHGGLTFCAGGTHLIFGQTGYLGTTFFGCLLLWLSRYPFLTRPLLVTMAGTLLFAAAFYMPPALEMRDYAEQARESIILAVALAALLLAFARWLPGPLATLLVVFLAVQTALNALYDILVLLKLSLGMYDGASFSDATNMAKLTGIPAVFWSLFWGASSLVMLLFTIRFAYGGKEDR